MPKRFIQAFYGSMRLPGRTIAMTLCAAVIAFLPLPARAETAAGEGALEARIFLGQLGGKLPKGMLRTRFSVAQTNSAGSWITESNVDKLNVDYFE